MSYRANTEAKASDEMMSRKPFDMVCGKVAPAPGLDLQATGRDQATGVSLSLSITCEQVSQRQPGAHCTITTTPASESPSHSQYPTLSRLLLYTTDDSHSAQPPIDAGSSYHDQLPIPHLPAFSIIIPPTLDPRSDNNSIPGLPWRFCALRHHPMIYDAPA